LSFFRVLAKTKYLLKDYKGALVDLNRADRARPDSHVTLRARGNVKRKLGNYKDALRDLNRANDLRPDSSWILGYIPIKFDFNVSSLYVVGDHHQVNLDDDASGWFHQTS
jgi:tetratricopeptide (TPR) repeat protein